MRVPLTVLKNLQDSALKHYIPWWVCLTNAAKRESKGYGCMKDSAGKFCPDKWTRKGEEGRVEGKDHEEVLHEEVKEEPDVATRPTARTHS